MNLNDLIFFKNFLLSQKSSILNKSLEFRSEDLQSYSDSGDDAEAAATDLSISVSISLHERARISLVQIDQALDRITSGTYGICEGCEEPIEIRRLKARPLTTLCINCMEDSECSRPLH